MLIATLDVNVLVSALLNPHGAPRQAIQAWEAGYFTHVTSYAMIATLEAKLTTPDLVRRFAFLPTAGQVFLSLVHRQATVLTIPPTAIASVTGDPEDDGVLATARLGGSSYLVTGDRLLLNLSNFEGVTILTPRAFVALLHGSSHSP